jgi:hypothetical protein
VSFTTEDLTEMTCAAPSTLGTTLPSSPIRPRSKRAAASLTTPIHSHLVTAQACFGPRRKKRRGPGTLADAPRLPCSFADDHTSPRFSPFDIYDQRLERLVSRLITDNVPTSPPSPIQVSSDDDNLMPPVVSWMKPRNRRRGRRAQRVRAPAPSFPCLSPRPGQPLTPMESLALSIEASPILPLGSNTLE